MSYEEQKKSIGSIKNNECDCPFFDSDPFGEDVARIRGEK